MVSALSLTWQAECTAKDADEWTNYSCVFASGSPFDDVIHDGKTYSPGQGSTRSSIFRSHSSQETMHISFLVLAWG
jgi:hypothetical protein